MHTHSAYAMAWAAVGRDIPCFLTAMADAFGGLIPCAVSGRARVLVGSAGREVGAYEGMVKTSETLIDVAMIRLLLRRLVRAA